MPLFEALFKIRHDCPFIGITEKFPSAKVFFWGRNSKHEVIEVIVEDRDEYGGVIREIHELLDIIDEFSDGDKMHVLIPRCTPTPEGSVLSHIDACNIFLSPPVIHREGWEYYRLVAFKHDDLEDLIARFEQWGFEYEIMLKTPIDGPLSSLLALPVEAMFSDLTVKQMEAILLAHKNGYYQFPRESTVKDIASKQKISRTTYQEHLRKAQNKMINHLIPYLQLYSEGRGSRTN